MKEKNEMSLVRLKINNIYRYGILNYLSEQNSIYIKPKKHEKLQKSEKDALLIEQIGLLRQSVETLFRDFDIQLSEFFHIQCDEKDKFIFEVKDLQELMNKIQEEINFFERRHLELERNTARLKIELENLNFLKLSYSFLENFNITRDGVDHFQRLKFKVFTTFTKNLDNLKILLEFSEFPCIYQTHQISDDRICFFVIYPKNGEEELTKRLNIIFAEEIPIVKKFLTPDGVDFERINESIKVIEKNQIKYQKELERIRDDNILRIAAIYETIQNIEQNLWALNQFEQESVDRITVEFFVPIDKKKEIIDGILHNFRETPLINSIDISKKHPIFESELDQDYSEKVISDKESKERKELSESEVKEKDLRNQAPTIMRNNFLVRPFETITRMYGTPSYHEIDPTPFIAITFPLIFGLMFGDVGHGFILVISGLIGAYIFRARKGTDLYNLCWIIFYCGLGAILGGFLYGEIFGTHELEIFNIVIWQLHPITIPILNITLYNPLNNIMTTFKFAILIGVFHINLGWLIQAVNYWKQERKYLAFSDSIMKILLLTGGTILLFTYGFDINSWLIFPYPILLPLVPGILLIVLKPLGKALRVPSLKQESYGGLIGEGSIETFETLLSVMSNAASYIRLLALSLAHISLLLAIRAMVDIIQGEGLLFQSLQTFGLIFGNIIVILLEGLLVFLNTMRLHFYEFFFKFFQGSGKEYAPFHLTSQFSVIKFELGLERDLISEDIEKEIETKKTIEEIEKAKKYIMKKYL